MGVPAYAMTRSPRKSRPSFRPLLADRVKRMTPPSHYADLDF